MRKFVRPFHTAVALGAIVVALFLAWTLNLFNIQTLALAPEEKTPPSTQSRTTVFFILQRAADLTAGTQADQTFDVFIGESTPVVKSAFVELRGIRSSPGASPSLTVSIDDTPLTSSRATTFNLDTSASTTPFKLSYNGTNYIGGQISAPGTKTFTLSVKANDITLSALSAKLRLTYQLTPPTEGGGGGFKAIATVISSTFDTAVTNGAAPNTLTWKGSEPVGTRVGFQFASSDAVGGPFTYYGPGGTPSIPGDMYEADADVAIEIKAAHHNKRYFRYKAILCSNTDCVTVGGASTPRVDDVILNWAP